MEDVRCEKHPDNLLKECSDCVVSLYVEPRLEKANLAVKFRDADESGEDRCGTCRFFKYGTCTLVEGTIESDNLCNLWRGVVRTDLGFGESDEGKILVGNLMESKVMMVEASSGDGSQWAVILIKEGKSVNKRRYRASVLKEAAPLFEGVKAFADHPTREQRSSGDGRSVREIVGWYEDVYYDDKIGGIVGTLNVLETAQWLRDLLLEQAEKEVELVGLSINAEGEQSAVREGSEFVMDVTSITSVTSVDIVNEPAAGGAIVRLVASKEGEAMDIADALKAGLSPDELKTLRPDLAGEIDTVVATNESGGDGDDGSSGDGGEAEGDGDAGSTSDASGSDGEADDDSGDDDDASSDDDSSSDESSESSDTPEPVTAGAVTEAVERIAKIERGLSAALVESKLSSSRLPDPLKASLKISLLEANKKAPIDEGAIDTAIKDHTTLWAQMEGHYGSGRPRVPLTEAGGSETMSGHDKIIKGIDGLFEGKDVDGVPRFNSIKQAYCEWTGKSPFSVDPMVMFRESQSGAYDSGVQGRAFMEGVNLLEAATTASWGEVFADRLFRRMLSEYRVPNLDDWRKVVSNIETITDFRTQRRIRIGGYGTLAGVSEGDTYPTLTTPGDEEATYAITKRGGLETITFEMMVNDDLRNIRNIPVKLARAAKQTLYRFVFDFFNDNAAIYDADALFHSNHSNLQTAALADAGLDTQWQAMRAQAAFGNSVEILGSRPKFVLVPAELEQTAWTLVNSAVVVGATNNAGTEPNFYSGRLEPIIVDYWTDPSDWFLVADPNSIPTIELGFLNGQEEPELFVQDQPNVGSVMTADKITYKVRHIYSGTVLDFRGMTGNVGVS